MRHRRRSTTIYEKGLNFLEKLFAKDNQFAYASITAKPFFEKQGYTVAAENKVIRNGITLINYKMIKCGGILYGFEPLI